MTNFKSSTHWKPFMGYKYSACKQNQRLYMNVICVIEKHNKEELLKVLPTWMSERWCAINHREENGWQNYKTYYHSPPKSRLWPIIALLTYKDWSLCMKCYLCDRQSITKWSCWKCSPLGWATNKRKLHDELQNMASTYWKLFVGHNHFAHI